MNNNDNEENKNEDFSFEETTEMGDEKSMKEKIKDLNKKLKEKTEEAKFNLDGWQRARAELVNKEKQLSLEKIDIFKNAASNILEEIVPVLDSYEIARKNKDAWEKVESNWRMGVEYIFAQLISVVEGNGLKKIEPTVGENFDIQKMHAIEEVETEDVKKDHTISETIQSGYELNGKLLREAKVKIFIKK